MPKRAAGKKYIYKLLNEHYSPKGIIVNYRGRSGKTRHFTLPKNRWLYQRGTKYQIYEGTGGTEPHQFRVGKRKHPTRVMRGRALAASLPRNPITGRFMPAGGGLKLPKLPLKPGVSRTLTLKGTKRKQPPDLKKLMDVLSDDANFGGVSTSSASSTKRKRY
jgi:hypothetical protein